MTQNELEQKSLVELRILAKELGLTSVNKHRKSELVQLLIAGERPPVQKRGRKPLNKSEQPIIADTVPPKDPAAKAVTAESKHSSKSGAAHSRVKPQDVVSDPDRFISIDEPEANNPNEELFADPQEQPVLPNIESSKPIAPAPQPSSYLNRPVDVAEKPVVFRKHGNDRGGTYNQGQGYFVRPDSENRREYQPNRNTNRNDNRGQQDNRHQQDYRFQSDNRFQQDNRYQQNNRFDRSFNRGDDRYQQDNRRNFVDKRSYEKPDGYFNADYGTSNPAVPEMLEQGTCREVAGILEMMDGYGFLRCDNYCAGQKDIYIAIAQIRRFMLRVGDYVEGRARPKREGDKYEALMYIDRVNGLTPDENARRPSFDELVPIFPQERYTLEVEGERDSLAARLIDLIAPIGKGSRAMIVSQPKAGKTTLLKSVARGISTNFPDSHLIILLIDERPEEVTDIKRSTKGEVVFSTFDELPEHHTRIAEMVQERAMRLVEQGKDVVILMDSLTRLTRAYNLVIPPTGRTLSGGMDPGALHSPKRFFGAARNIEGGGSLTIIATALVETGSRLDDIVYEEFKGTGNLEIHLDRKLAEKRIFPAIDIYKSGTRREDLLLSQAELDGVYMLRKVLSGGASTDVTEQFVGMLAKTATNEEFLIRLKDWVRIYEKEGYVAGGSNRY